METGFVPLNLSLGVIVYHLMKRFYDVSDPGYIHTIVVGIVGAIFGGLVFIVFGFSEDAQISLFVLAGFLAVMLLQELSLMMDRDWIGWLPGIVAFIAGGAAVNGLVFGLMDIPVRGWIGTILSAVVMVGLGFSVTSATDKRI